MPISDWIERLGRTLFETPFTALADAGERPELAEVRLALLDEVKAQSHKVGGRYVFPHNIVHVELRGVPEQQAKVFKGSFLAQFCQDELRRGLARAGYRFPDDLQVEIETTPSLPERAGKWVTVTSEVLESPRVATPVKRTGRLIVVKGTATPPELLLNKARVNLGRTADVYRTDGPSRRNDLAFEEAGEINKTVSREHAHILFDKESGEYRLFNDRWYKNDGQPDQSCGLWILRDGLSQAVHRDSRGARLLAGDEIHLGRAVVRFTAK